MPGPGGGLKGEMHQQVVRKDEKITGCVGMPDSGVVQDVAGRFGRPGHTDFEGSLHWWRTSDQLGRTALRRLVAVTGCIAEEWVVRQGRSR